MSNPPPYYMYDINTLCHLVRQTAHDIHAYLGPGHLDKVYENALIHRLRKHGLRAEQQSPVAVYDEDGTLIGDCFAAILVEKCLIIELKTAKALPHEQQARILGYLKSSRLEHGMLINFKSYKFQIRKFTLKTDRPTFDYALRRTGLMNLF